MTKNASAAAEERRPVNELVGMNVGLIMRLRGKTQKELAFAIGVTQTSMSRRIAGITDWAPDEMAGVARLLEVSVGRLFDPLPDLGMQKGPESGVSGPSLPDLDSNQEPTGIECAPSWGGRDVVERTVLAPVFAIAGGR